MYFSYVFNPYIMSICLDHLNLFNHGSINAAHIPNILYKKAIADWMGKPIFTSQLPSSLVSLLQWSDIPSQYVVRLT